VSVPDSAIAAVLSWKY